MALLPVNTQRWIPWLETVVFTSVRPNSANVTESTNAAAVYRLGESEGAPSFGVYTKYDVKFAIAIDDLAFTLKPRDLAVWNGDTYTVMTVERSDWTKHTVAWGRNLVLAADLRQTGILKRPSGAQDATGRQRLLDGDYATVTSGIACRVQPEGGIATDALDKRILPNRFTAYLGIVVDARAKDRFEVGSAKYTILESAKPERIDELMTLTLELVGSAPAPVPPPPPPPPPPPEALAVYRLNGDFTDDSGNGFDLALDVGVPGYAAGKFGQALFNDEAGVSGCRASVASLGTIAAPWSMGVWGKCDTEFVSCDLSWGSLALNINPNGTFFLFIFPSGIFLTAPQPGTFGLWHHFATTYDGTTARLYTDGVLVNSVTRVIPDRTGVFNVNVDVINDARSFIDDVVVVPALWSDQNVLDIYNSPDPYPA